LRALSRGAMIDLQIAADAHRPSHTAMFAE
jgi:hypothetical protein